MTTLNPPPALAEPVIGRAVRDALPVVLAYAPFGLALGATLSATHLPSWIAWSSSPLLFGGAAQLLAVQMLDAGAAGVFVVLGALVVNARMLLYSAALAPVSSSCTATSWAAPPNSSGEEDQPTSGGTRVPASVAPRVSPNGT